MNSNLYRSVYLLFLSYNLFSQKIIIQDELGNSIPDAYVVYLESKLWSRSNSYGIADISAINDLDKKIIIKRYGFENLYLRSTDKNIVAVLKRKPVLFDSIAANSNYSKYLKKIEYNAIYKTAGQQNLSHKEFLELLPGLSVHSLGGPGSITTVSINGGPTSQTRVELNGFELTNMQTGVTDLSQIPSALIEGARVITTGNRTTGSGSQNGVLSLDIIRPRNSIYFSKGSYGSHSSYAQYSLHRKKVNTSILVGQQYEEGNYPVSWRNSKFKRTNNFFDQRFAAIQLNSIYDSNLLLKGFGFISNQNRGIPGLVWSPLQAALDDQILMLGLNIKRYLRFGESEIKLMKRSAQEVYSNPTYSIFSQNKINTFSAHFNNTFYVNNMLESEFGIRFENQELNSSNYNHTEKSFIEFLNFKFSLPKSLFFYPSLEKIHYGKKINKTTFSILLSYIPIKSIIENLSFSRSSHFRKPTFNDLYWIPGGNPELNPENGNNINANLKLRLSALGLFNINLFKSETDNMIQWLPIQSYWKATNINKVERSGWTLNWIYKVKSLKATSSFSSISSRSGKSNLPLRYTPKNLSTIKVDWLAERWIISSQINYTDEMISMYSYPKNNILPANRISSIFISKRFLKSDYSILPTISISNIENKQYESSKGYPEEGRSFRLSLTISKQRTN